MKFIRTIVTVFAFTTMASANELIDHIQQFRADEQSLERKYPIAYSPTRAKRMSEFYESELRRIPKKEFAKLPLDAQVDVFLLDNYTRRQIHELKVSQEQLASSAPLLAHLPKIVSLEEDRRKMAGIEPAKAAAELNQLSKEIKERHDSVVRFVEGKPQAKEPEDLRKFFDEKDPRKKRTFAYRAANIGNQLAKHLEDWYEFYHGYDPLFTWWCEAPYREVKERLTNYHKFVRERIAGVTPDDRTTIIGYPIGRDALLAELEFERIAYTPEELFAIAEREYEWCLKEIKSASAQLGFGDDWQKAIEHVKTQYVEPGKQPEMIREMAWEAIRWLEKNDMLTVPELAKETWRMDMLSPQAQLQSPFFLGGESILVSFPTNEMGHDAKMMSMRGNNRYFSRAVVHHELIPGHHLQQFMNARYAPYRELFYTPFWTEGWALYWEFRLYDKGFAAKPEEKVGMMFWRMHRCIRILFSLGFHLGKLTPEECIDMLVERVGHERDNAAAEVRRSFAGNYGPLYQIAYMVGGLQIQSLHKDLVSSKKMTEQQFHDTILKNGSIPIEAVRSILTKTPPPLDAKPNWKF